MIKREKWLWRPLLPLDHGRGRRATGVGDSLGEALGRRPLIAVPRTATPNPSADTTTSPPPSPHRSIATPASGAPRAEPVVIAEPCHPSASPRAVSGTTRLSWSTVAVIVGAHTTPATNARPASVQLFGANAIGTVAALSPASSKKAGMARCKAP